GVVPRPSQRGVLRYSSGVLPLCQNDGILQPLVVRRHESGGFELVAGERRLRASLKLNLEAVPVVIRDMDPDDLLELALIENIQREDLNPIETARAYHQLRERNKWTQADLASQLGKKRSSVANSLRLLELPEPIQDAIARGSISAGHAKLLLSVADSEREEWLEQILEHQWTVRELESALRGPVEAEPEPDPEPAEPQAETPPARSNDSDEPKVKAPHVAEQENILSTSLGTKVEIREGRGRGKIVIEYYSTDDYERIKRQLLGQ
ncbi:MAG: ParB/RepB/Spo0J family partition protein, partial [Planctomycetota bacterium]